MTDADRPVIFLDFDGVLNSMTTSRERTPGGHNQLDREMVERVNRILDRYAHQACGVDTGGNNVCPSHTKPDVVVSSSWRLRTSEEFPDPIARMAHVLEENGADFNVAGVTPRLDHCPHHVLLGPVTGGGMVTTACPWNGYCRRGMEIQQWLTEQGADRPVAILDDSIDMGPMLPWLVRTYGAEGLRDFHVDQVLALLRFQQGHPPARPLAALASVYR